MWSGSQVALTWSEAWAIDNPGLVKMQVEGTLSYEAQRERAGFRFGFEAAQARGASRATPPAELTLQAGNDEAWSLREVLAKLVEGADILLHQKDYDGAHWELIQSAWERGRRYLSDSPAPATQPPPRDPAHWTTFVKDTALTIDGLMAEVERLRKQLSDASDTIRNLVSQKQRTQCLSALSALAPPADHEPFAPMECCGRDRDKDGGPNPHCECPAPFKASPADEAAGLLADCGTVRDALNTLAVARRRVGTDVESTALERAALNRLENHLKGKR